jgi:DNA-binding transcriptional LysR family regulator
LDLRMPAHWLDRIKLRHLRTLLAIEEQGGIGRAAERLNVTQPAVSKTIAEIEAMIGAELFERRGHMLVPTDIGHQVIRAARRVGSELRVLGEEVDLIAEGGAGAITIGLQAVSVIEVVAKVVAAVKARHPRVTVRLIEDTLPNILRDLRGGRYDLAFGRILPKLLEPDLASMPIAAEPYIVVASVGHPLLNAPHLSWEEACRHVWCLPLLGTPMREHLADYLSTLQLALPKQLIETGSALSISTLLSAMPLLATLPVNLAANWIAQKICVPTSLSLPPRPEAIGLIWSKTEPLTPTARIFHSETTAVLTSTPVPPLKRKRRSR